MKFQIWNSRYGIQNSDQAKAIFEYARAKSMSSNDDTKEEPFQSYYPQIQTNDIMLLEHFPEMFGRCGVVVIAVNPAHGNDFQYGRDINGKKHKQTQIC